MRADSQRPRLTTRRREVLALVMQGRSSPEIAAALVISVKTADSHVGALLRRYRCHSKLELVAVLWARRCAAIEARCAEIGRLVDLATPAAANLPQGSSHAA